MEFSRYQASTCALPELGFTLELGRMAMSENFFKEKEALIKGAFAAMHQLEAGSLANPDEQRRVGHYWLRTPALAPDEMIRSAIENTLAKVISFASKTHKEGRFQNLLVIGIGGSALGPQFIAQALDMGEANKLTPFFFDNTDPDGMDSILHKLDLKRTLVVVISKSGSTPETRNGLLEAQAAWADAKLKFPAHAVAITQEGSVLDQLAVNDGWLARFPMWDWVGGRTSVTSAVGLLPMALQGLDIGKFLEGAAAMDAQTRITDVKKNPAALLALAWHFAGGGVGARAMVVLPYKDRLMLFSKYLQQLVMESLGKALDMDGKRVHQGLTVYGNKGSTDQHAYVQQLRDGLNNFFATFIEVQKEREGVSIDVEPGVTSGDYLQGLCLGTAEALEENFRQSMTLILSDVSAFSVGALIALFERAVGLYATLINVNAYHQPGVEAGKKAAASILTLKKKIVELIITSRTPMTVEEIAAKLNASPKADIVYRILERLAANPSYGVQKSHHPAFQSKYSYAKPH